MITRADYMAGRADLWAYYGEIASEIGLRTSERLQHLCRRSTDPAFNDVPIAEWSGPASIDFDQNLRAALHRRGDIATMASLIAVRKAAARAAILADEPRPIVANDHGRVRPRDGRDRLIA